MAKLLLTAERRRAVQRLKESATAQQSADVEKIAQLTRDQFPKQRKFYQDPAHRVAALCSRRAGKTTAGCPSMLLAAATTPNGSFLYVNETSAEARRIAWHGAKRDGMFSIIERLGMEDRGVVVKDKSMEIVFTAINSRIRLAGADDERGVKKLLGVPYNEVWWDEAQKIPAGLTETIQGVLVPSLLDYSGRIRLTGTPEEDQSGWFYDITRDDDEAIKGWSVHRWNLLENPHFGRVRYMNKRWFVLALTDNQTQKFGPYKNKAAADRAVPESRMKTGIHELRDGLGDKDGPLPIDHPKIQREGFGVWTSKGSQFTYSVNKVEPASRLYYAPARTTTVTVRVVRVGPDGVEWEDRTVEGFPDIARALQDLPCWKTRDYYVGVGLDIGWKPDPFALVIGAWSMEDPTFYEVGSWGGIELDSETQRALLLHIAKSVHVCVWTADAGGSGRPSVEGWAKDWVRFYGIPIDVADKSDKNIAIESANADIERGAARFRDGSQIVAQMRRVQWVKKRSSTGALRESPNIPNDLCLAAGSLVQTASGPQRIDAITVGTEVWTRTGLRMVTRSGQTGHAPLLALETTGGRTLYGTAGHPVLTGRGWVALAEMMPGDVITAWSDSAIAVDHVRSVRPTRVAAPVFNLTVDGAPEFFADGILVHNCDGWLYLHRSSAPHRRVDLPPPPVQPGTPEALEAEEARMLKDNDDGRDPEDPFDEDEYDLLDFF